MQTPELSWSTSCRALRGHLIQMYLLSDFQRYQALQCLPLLFDQRPSELMDNMLVLLPEDEKPGFRGLWTASQLIFEHICSQNLLVTLVEWLLLMNCGQSKDTGSLSRFYLISLRMFMLCCTKTTRSTRSGARSSVPRSSSRSSVPKDGS